MFQEIERHGISEIRTPSNLLYHGENLDVMECLLDNGLGEQFKLIYCDPPFFSGSSYRYRQQDELQQVDLLSYDDKWPGGISEYLGFLQQRLQLMRKLLASEGSLWFHVGLKASHHVKMLLDDIFGEQQWVNQIIWKKTNSPKSQSRSFGNQYDVILVYAKNKRHFKLNSIYKEPSPEYLRNFSKDDGDGRGPYQTVALMAGGLQRPAGRKVFEFRGVKAAWLYSKEKLEQFWNEGRIYQTRSGRYRLKVYLKDVAGQPISDLWIDKEVAPIQGISSEYLGFQTQKPESLIRRILLAASREGDLIGDFFVGSGTTVAVAQKLGRRWIASDFSSVAIHLTRKRLLMNSFNLNGGCVLKTSREQDWTTFAVLEYIVKGKNVISSLESIRSLTSDVDSTNILNLYYWNEGNVHVLVDDKAQMHQDLKLEKVITTVLSSCPHDAELMIHLHSHAWRMQLIHEIRKMLREKEIESFFWCISPISLKYPRLFVRLKEQALKKKRNKTRKLLNDPMRPWPAPRVDLVLKLEGSQLMICFNKFEVPTVQSRLLDSQPSDKLRFHLNYCGVQLNPNDDPLFCPDVVFFPSRGTTIDWTRLHVDLDRILYKREKDLEKHQHVEKLVLRLQCIDLLGRSIIGSFIVTSNDPVHVVV